MKNMFSLWLVLFFLQAACSVSPTSFIKSKNKKQISKTTDNQETLEGSAEQDGSEGDQEQGNGDSPEGSSEEGSSGEEGTSIPEPKAELQAGLFNNVIWKRYRAMENGMMRAMGLNKEQLCNELGQFSCVDRIHLFNLGGNDPFVAAQGKRASDPTILTPVAMERLAMHACVNRLELDKAAGSEQALVFKGFAINADPMPADAIGPLVTELYRRILARDPSPEELGKMGEFAQQGIGSEQFAKSACFVIATLYENIFI